MRLMSYNILSGGQARTNGRDRLGDILAVCRRAAPDILALQEANGIDKAEIADRFHSLGLPYHAVALAPPYLDGERYHVAVFSRWPLSAPDVFAQVAFETAALKVNVHSPLGLLTLVNLHLHSTSEAERLGEISGILKSLPGDSALMVTGDFNAISRFDPYPDTAGEFENRTDVTDRLAHLVDLFAARPGGPHWTHPSRCKADHSRRINRRIDYVFADSTLALRVQDAQVIRTDQAHRASDHFPVVVDLR